MIEYVILVNENDQQVGLMEKIEAHEKAALHRAFSVFIFNKKGELMLQQRAASKYHSPLLWTNTCCSHQRSGESNLEAGRRRLESTQISLENSQKFVYKKHDPKYLDEYLMPIKIDYLGSSFLKRLSKRIEQIIKPKKNPNTIPFTRAESMQIKIGIWSIAITAILFVIGNFII